MALRVISQRLSDANPRLSTTRFGAQREDFAVKQRFSPAPMSSFDRSGRSAPENVDDLTIPGSKLSAEDVGLRRFPTSQAIQTLLEDRNYRDADPQQMTLLRLC